MINKLIHRLFILTTLVSCSYGYVITNDNQKIEGRINLPVEINLDRLTILRNKKNIVVKAKGKHHRFNAKEINSITLNKLSYTKKITPYREYPYLYKPLTLMYGTFLGQQIKKKENAIIYLCVYNLYSRDIEDYNEYVLKSNNGIIIEINPLAALYPLYYFSKDELSHIKTQKERRKKARELQKYVPNNNEEIILNFINKRYNQHFTFKGINRFKNIDEMLNYILDQESAREENKNKTSN
jgi:hypothetical protein